MSNNVVPFSAGRAPSIFAGKKLPDMAAAGQEGLLASFAVIGYKGRNWRIKYRGEEELLKDPRTKAPVATLEVVIVGVSPYISKQYYEKAYSEGDDAAPDCFSVDGKVPDATSPKKQCATCAACPQNVFGSKITEAGKKAKNCQDSRRIAVVPSGDIENASYGGPMLLRMPAMTLSGFAKFNSDLGRFSAQPYMVETVLGFDYDVAYPLVTFTPSGWLTDEQGAAVLKVLDDPLIERILEAPDVAVADAAPVEASPLAAPRPAAFNKPNDPVADDGPSDAQIEADAAANTEKLKRDQKARKLAELQAQQEALEAEAENTNQPEVALEPEEDEDDKAIRIAEEAIAARKAAKLAKEAGTTVVPAQGGTSFKGAVSAAQAAPVSAAQAAPVAKKSASVFGGGGKAAVAAAPVETAEDTEKTAAKPALAAAPANLESAIDDLLSA